MLMGLARVFLCALFISQGAQAATPLFTITSDKATYLTTDTVNLTANFTAVPSNADYEFDLVSNVSGVSVDTTRANSKQLVVQVSNLPVGTYTWQVQVVLQETRYAKDLKTGIQNDAAQIISLNSQIAAEQDPVKKAALQNTRDQVVAEQASFQAELANVRTPVLTPVSLTFSVHQ